MPVLARPASGRNRLRLSKSKLTAEESFLTSFESVSLGLSGFFFRDNFLGTELCHQIRAEARKIVKNGRPRPAGIGQEARTDTEIRGDHFCWMEKEEAGPGVRALMGEFEELRCSMNREFYLGLDRYEMQLAQYRENSKGYKRHFDAFKGKNQRNRRLTAIYYLNPRWEQGHGGELEVYPAGGSLLLEPIADRLVVFFAEQLEHAVLPTEAERLALTAWFHSP